MSELSAIGGGGMPATPAAPATQNPTAVNPSPQSAPANTAAQVSLSSASQTSIQMGQMSQTTAFSMSEQNIQTMLLIAALMELLMGNDDDDDKGKNQFAVMLMMALLSQSSQQQMSAVTTTNQSYMAASVSTVQSAQANVVYGDAVSGVSGDLAAGNNLNVMA